jgi:carbamoyltransferase
MKPLEHEFKVMGMAPYAHYESVLRVKKVFDKLYCMDENGEFKQTVSFYDIPVYFIRHLTYERFDVIAGAVQLFTEEILIKWVRYWINKTGIHSITCGGGLFMNVKAAKRIYELDEVTDVFITPSAGDESLAIGALYYGNNILNQSITEIKDLYLGREFSDEYIKNYLETIKDRYEADFFSEDEMAVQAARLLANNKIVARCAGREEWGARALGNRSIMCNAKHYKNIDILNQYIKSRDFWMPFTPSILAEDMDEYIVNPKKMFAPYMCISFDSTAKAREEIPAAIHPKDYTVRPQAVVKEWNSGYYQIIAEFKKLTGCGAILNTSFNLHGEPNVGGPEDAIHTLDNSKLEYVILGSFLVHKKSVSAE